jgi:hypothetical protein
VLLCKIDPKSMPMIGAQTVHPAAYEDRRRRLSVGPPPAAEAAERPGDDSDRLLTLLGVFTIAMVAVVLALLGAAAIDTWWALALLMGVHFAMTALSFAAVLFVFSGNLHAPRAPRLSGRR